LINYSVFLYTLWCHNNVRWVTGTCKFLIEQFSQGKPAQTGVTSEKLATQVITKNRK